MTQPPAAEDPLFLERIGLFVPETFRTVQELSEPLNLTSGQVRLFNRFLGVDRVPVATGIELGEMLTEAGEQALDGADRDSVRFLIHTHTIQHAAPPAQNMLDTVRRKLGLNRASAFGMSHVNCVAGLYAQQVARGLLHDAGPEDKALLLFGDKIQSHRLRLIPDTTVLGDAAAACLVGRDPRGHRVIGQALDVLGRFYQCLDGPEPLQTEYKELYSARISSVMRAAIEDAGCTPEQIAGVLPHNVNRLSWKRISNGLGIPAGRVYLENVPKLGHCYTADPYMNLAAATSDGLLRPGDLALMASAGLGAAFAAAVIRIGEGIPR